MRLESDSSTYPSYMGAILTIVVVLIMIAFAMAKTETLLGLKDIDIIETFIDNAIDDSE